MNVSPSLSHLRHELRGTLNQVIGYTELLEEQVGDKEADMDREGLQSDLQKIHSAAKQLLSLIDENLGAKNLAHLLEKVEDKEPENLQKEQGESPSPTATAAQEIFSAVSTPPPSSGLAGNILVVDDTVASGQLLVRQLQSQGHTATLTENGRKALEILRTPGQTPYDLVLLDIMMPELDGFQTLIEMKSDPTLRSLPVIILSALDELEGVAKCIENGAEDYLRKPFQPTLLRARIDASLEKKMLRDYEQLYIHTIEQTHTRLTQELSEASRYVRSLLPKPIESPLKIDWRFFPSTELGGDAFGYHLMDPEHFAVYLIDVCGHGVGAALLSATLLNVLRSQSLADTNFYEPDTVLSALNKSFPAEQQNEMFFTLWYGVYHFPTRTLKYANGGHPPPMLMTPKTSEKDPNPVQFTPLPGRGLVIGAMEDARYESQECTISPQQRLIIFSDGIYELPKKGGGSLSYAEYLELLPPYLSKHNPNAIISTSTQTILDSLIQLAHQQKGEGAFDDDISVIEIQFA